MLGRAVIAFLVLPGMVAYVIPVLLAPPDVGGVLWRVPGAILIVTGSVLLLWCVRDFYIAGRGTLAPWTPPRHLVRIGLYRWSRNPMYISVLLVVLGWAVFHRSKGLMVYLAALATAFHLRIVLYEEPHLLQDFGEEYVRYALKVPRWALPVRRQRSSCRGSTRPNGTSEGGRPRPRR